MSGVALHSIYRVIHAHHMFTRSKSDVEKKERLEMVEYGLELKNSIMLSYHILLYLSIYPVMSSDIQ